MPKKISHPGNFHVSAKNVFVPICVSVLENLKVETTHNLSKILTITVSVTHLPAYWQVDGTVDLHTNVMVARYSQHVTYTLDCGGPVMLVRDTR